MGLLRGRVTRVSKRRGGSARPAIVGLVGLVWVLADGLVITGLGLGMGAARGDQFFLKDGSKISGEMAPVSKAEETGGMRSILMGDTVKPMVIRADQIVRTTQETTLLDDYLARRDAAAKVAAADPNAEAGAETEYALGEWCRKAGLLKIGRSHFERAIALDPKHPASHERLGHVLHDEKWMTKEEYAQSQGWVLHQGKWISPEEKAALDVRSEANASRVALRTRLRTLRDQLLRGGGSQNQNAERELLEIHDPLVVGPIVELFAKQPPKLRILMVRVLSGISAPESTKAALDVVLEENDETALGLAMEILQTREDHRRDVLKRLQQSLASKNAFTRGRAAETLARLGASAAVPKLVDSLLSIEKRMVWVEELVTNSNGNGLGVNISQLSPGGTGSTGGTGTGGGAGGQTIVIPGAVAPQQPRTRPALRPVAVTVEHPLVLNALQNLTGQDFGYNIPLWKKWLVRGFEPNPGLNRRVIQP